MLGKIINSWVYVYNVLWELIVSVGLYNKYLHLI